MVAFCRFRVFRRTAGENRLRSAMRPIPSSINNYSKRRLPCAQLCGVLMQPGPTCVPRSLWCTLRIPGRQSVDCPLADESGKCASLPESRGGCALLSRVIRVCRTLVSGRQKKTYRRSRAGGRKFFFFLFPKLFHPHSCKCKRLQRINARPEGSLVQVF